MSRDILKHNWKLPSDTVYIFGTGPNGKDHYGRVPANSWIIGVNKAINLQEPISIWLCADGTLPKQEWFTKSAEYVISQKFILDDHHRPTPCFDAGTLLKAYPNVPYYIIHGHTLRESPPFAPEEGVLRSGGSISAQAIQLAYWLGAKRIVLVGVDMAGKTYFDDTTNLNPRLLPDGKSKHLRIMNGLCTWLRARGTEVVSLSPTALNVKVI